MVWAFCIVLSWPLANLAATSMLLHQCCYINELSVAEMGVIYALEREKGSVDR
jgi:hypothetical protein